MLHEIQERVFSRWSSTVIGTLDPFAELRALHRAGCRASILSEADATEQQQRSVAVLFIALARAGKAQQGTNSRNHTTFSERHHCCLRSHSGTGAPCVGERRMASVVGRTGGRWYD